MTVGCSVEGTLLAKVSWTKALVSALVADGVTGATVLDIGGGVGVIGYELLDAGAASVTNVEASAGLARPPRCSRRMAGTTKQAARLARGSRTP